MISESRGYLRTQEEIKARSVARKAFWNRFWANIWSDENRARILAAEGRRKKRMQEERDYHLRRAAELEEPDWEEVYRDKEAGAK